MSCNHPFYAFDTGCLTDSGKKDFILAISGTCDRMDASHSKKKLNIPQLLHDGKADVIDGHLMLINPIRVPCGSCVGCRMDRAREWKVRNCMELPYHDFSYFLTLTYDDDHLPFNDFGEPVLLKEDLQKFWKRFRKAGYELSYFSCGEYGDNTHRPHFHALVYLDQDIPGFSLVSPYHYANETIQSLWKNGMTMVEEVAPGNIAYVSGYVEKKQKDPDYELYPVKPFSLMSRRPAIGFRYIDDHYRSIVETKKVYGSFGNDAADVSASVPRSIMRRFESEPWYADYKALAQLSAETVEELMPIVYKVADRETIGRLKDDGMNLKLDKRMKGRIL